MLKKCFYILILTAGLSSCYYDKEDELYPLETVDSDTLGVTYSKTVLPILENQCYVCHSQAAAQGNIVVEGYDKLKVQVDNGQFWGAINHEPGFTPMPQGGHKLPDRVLKQIRAWINKGAPND